jgi:catechol 2,3-dioxygenase-like lactoylglutathione lyase family enzyme
VSAGGDNAAGRPAVVLESPLFHATHLVDSYDTALGCYQRLFGRPSVHAGYWDVAGRWALYIYLGDVWMSVGVPAATSAKLRAFLDRFGNHLHSLGWYVRGVDALAEGFSQLGLRIGDRVDPAVAYGRFSPEGNAIARAVPRHGPIPLPAGYRHGYEPGWQSAVVYTHFRDTFGMLEFCEVTSHHPLPPRVPDADMLPAVDPLGIAGTSHFTTVVPDARAAAQFWLDNLGGELLHLGDHELLGTLSAWVRVGEGAGTVLELAEPTRQGPSKSDLEASRVPILHSMTFKVTDIARVRAHLDAEGFGIETESDTHLVTAPDTTAGARFAFTTDEVPTGSSA